MLIIVSDLARLTAIVVIAAGFLLVIEILRETFRG